MCNVGTCLLLLSFAFFREQMLQAVMAVHEQNVVHTDLKPANFVLVKGRLKIIDFGIAKAIANDTVNIHRDQQVGTVNYMSPEAIQKENGQNKLKVSQEAIASIVTLPLTLRLASSCPIPPTSGVSDVSSTKWYTALAHSSMSLAVLWSR